MSWQPPPAPFDPNRRPPPQQNQGYGHPHAPQPGYQPPPHISSFAPTPPTQGQGWGAPPTAYQQQPQPSYPPQGQPGYPPQQQGYPPQQPGYPPQQGQPGYPPPQHPQHPPFRLGNGNGPRGYPPQQQGSGYPPQQQQQQQQQPPQGYPPIGASAPPLQGRDKRGEATHAFGTADRDRSGFVDPQEFYIALRQLRPEMQWADAVVVFGIIDCDGNGRISLHEFVQHYVANY